MFHVCLKTFSAVPGAGQNFHVFCESFQHPQDEFIQNINDFGNPNFSFRATMRFTFDVLRERDLHNYWIDCCFYMLRMWSESFEMNKCTQKTHVVWDLYVN